MRDVLNLSEPFERGIARVPDYWGTSFLRKAENCVIESGGLKPWEHPSTNEFFVAGPEGACFVFKDHNDVYLLGDVGATHLGLRRVTNLSTAAVEYCLTVNIGTLTPGSLDLVERPSDGWTLESPSGEVERIVCSGTTATFYLFDGYLSELPLGTANVRIFVCGMDVVVEQGKMRLGITDGTNTVYGGWIFGSGWSYSLLHTGGLFGNLQLIIDIADNFEGSVGNAASGFSYYLSNNAAFSTFDDSFSHTSLYGKLCFATSASTFFKYNGRYFIRTTKLNETMCGLRGRLFYKGKYVGPGSYDDHPESGWNFMYDAEIDGATTHSNLVKWTGVGLKDLFYEMSPYPEFGRAATGEELLDVMERNEHGAVPISSNYDDEAIVCIRPFGQWVAVYCKDSIYMLRPVLEPTSTMMLEKIADFGILNETHVASSVFRHIFLSSEGKICNLDPEGQITIEGDSYFPTLSGDTIIGNHLGFDNSLIFTNGLDRTLFYKEGGFTEILQCIYSGIKVGDGRFYTLRGMDILDRYVRIRTGRLDMGTKRYKTVTGVEIGFRGPIDPFQNLLIHSYDSNGLIGTVSGVFNGSGYTNLSATGTSFEVELLNNYDPTDEQTSYIEWMNVFYSVDERAAGRPV